MEGCGEHEEAKRLYVFKLPVNLGASFISLVTYKAPVFLLWLLHIYSCGHLLCPLQDTD